ncbi:Cytochrome c-type biogenesis protein CcmF [Geodia barretti]|uniref:Cytochrome c-type biogenesis protein CcmF n=1 Tax=Geodia barretti TaxID=519541 RepID=A0AA35TIG2_GEOBA|nr:Cytochrome c-type biogenesis protein CcmF [Geodia barretti]
MTAEIGQAAIYLSVLSGLWAIGFLSIGLRTRNRNAIRSGRNAVVATFILISIATGALIYGFVTDDFSMRYVVEVSSAAQPLLYKITALWGRMSGSLLFWLWLLTVAGMIVVWQNHRHNKETNDTLSDYALIPMAVVQLFFIILVTGIIEGVYNPLDRFPNGQMAPDGAGMNPLLQTPSMAFHPPTLYIGWISLTVPFAFAVGALASGRIGSDWILRSRRWMLFSWIILTIGITLGGNWAYRELGWGGYWAWDPVENASFMPWLLGTAYLHSMMIQEKRNMFKLWNILLVTLAFQFTLLGTFITRSGIISSVHAFAQSDIGGYFLGFILASTAGVIGLIIYRWKRLKSANRLESLLSRESAFVLNNWLLVGLTLIILWGKTSPVYSVLCVSASVFVIAAISAEFYRGAKLRAKRQETSFLNGLNLLIQRNKRRYGGYIVHIGIVIVYIGIMGSKGYFLLESKSLRIGESMEVGQFQLTMKDSFEKEFANYRRTGIVFDVAKNGKQIGTMEPARHFYHKTGQGEPDTIESAIRHFGVNDFYISLGSIPPDVKTGGIVNVQAYYNPLIGVVWIGVAVMVLGGIVAIAEKSEHNKDSQ